MTRRLLATVAVLTLALVGTIWAEDAAKNQDTLPTIKNAAALQQEMLARQYHEFEQALLRLAQRLERSSKPEDKDKAVLLKKAIDLASKEGVNTRFDKLVSTLRSAKVDDLNEFRNAINESDALTKNLLEMLQLLLSDNRAAQLKAEEKRLAELIKEINNIIRNEKTIRNLNDAGKMDPNALAKAQEKVTEATESVANSLAGKKDAAGDPKASKGDPKNAKPGDPKGEGKNDTKEAKADGKPSEGKPNEGKPNEGKPGESKPNEGKPNEGKPSEAKPSEGKPNEGKPGESKPNEGKPNEGKPSEGKPSESKPSESKGKSDGKSESKPSEAKPSEGKPSESKSASKGQPSQSPPSQAKGDPQQGNPQQQPPSAEQQPPTPGKKQIQDAIENQKRAEDELKKAQRDPAGKNIDEAIKNLEIVRKKLEELLRQIREEETERLLTALQQRCEQMLQMQIEVYEGTVKIDKSFTDNPTDTTERRAGEQKSVQLGNREGEIVSICDKTIQLLQAEGSSVAFAHVFVDVRGEMVTVQNRLGRANVDTITQRHEENIIATLKEMIAALKKARQDMENKKNQPQPPKPSQQQDAQQKLIEMLAELKMIRSLQVRINSMTDLYGQQYKGEQADAPEIQKELRDLSDRQQKVQDITQKIAQKVATGQNQ